MELMRSKKAKSATTSPFGNARILQHIYNIDRRHFLLKMKPHFLLCHIGSPHHLQDLTGLLIQSLKILKRELVTSCHLACTEAAATTRAWSISPVRSTSKAKCSRVLILLGVVKTGSNAKTWADWLIRCLQVLQAQHYVQISAKL